MTHGYDDQGRQFDAEGNLENWWEKDAVERYQETAACYINYFNGITEEATGKHVS